MKKIIGYGSLLVTVGVLLTSAAYIFGNVVPPGFLGVRQVLTGPSQGFQKMALAAGYYGSIPFRTKIYLIPQTVQIVPIEKVTSSTRTGLSKGFDIPTADGKYVRVAASALVQFYDNPGDTNNLHGGPADLVERVGLNRDNWNHEIVTVCLDKLTFSLSSLRSSQFYDPAARNTALVQAQNNARETLKSLGINLQRILLDHYSYVDSKVSDSIFKTNIRIQEENTKAEAERFSEARAKLDQISATWDAKIESLKVEGNNKIMMVRSEGELYEKQKKADGDLVCANAQAEVEKMKADVLSKSQNAEILVAQEMAPLVSSLRGGIVEQHDPFDLD